MRASEFLGYMGGCDVSKAISSAHEHKSHPIGELWPE